MRNFTLFCCVIALAGATVAGILYFQIGDSKQRLYQELLEERARAEKLDANLSAARATEEGLRTTLFDLDAQLGQTKSTLLESQIKAHELHEVAELSRENLNREQELSGQLRTDLENLRLTLADERTRRASLVPTTDARRYRNAIAELESQVAQLESALSTLAAQNSTGDRTHHANHAEQAQVMGVGPQNAFVVINFGQRHGALTGHVMTISRQHKPVAEVEISDVRENYSIAQVLPDSLSQNVRKGDLATLTL